jgi:hypothetical protein
MATSVIISRQDMVDFLTKQDFVEIQNLPNTKKGGVRLFPERAYSKQAAPLLFKGQLAELAAQGQTAELRPVS